MAHALELGRRDILQSSLALAGAAMFAGPGYGMSADAANPTEASCKSRTAEQVTEGIDLSGKTALVTGSNAGIGHETLRVLTLRGATVYALARNAEKAQAACDEVNVPGAKGKAIPFACEQSDFSSVAECAEAILSRGAPIDILICNAGINLQKLEQVNGIEKDFVVNHLSHFLLVNRLLPLVKRAEQGRIAVVGSGAYLLAKRGMEFDNLSGEKDYEFLRMYGRSKLANTLFAKELARRLGHGRVTSNVLNPGGVNTQMNRNLLGTLFKPEDMEKLITVEEGAATSCFVATNPAIAKVTGAYFDFCRIISPGGMIDDRASAAKLWTISEELTRSYLKSA